MKSENPFVRMISWYISSASGIVLTVICLGAFIASAASGIMPAFWGFVLAGCVWLGGGLLSLRSPSGLKAVSDGLDREASEARRKHLGRVGEVLSSLSFLRLADEDVRKAVQHVHFRGGLYRDAAADADTFVPGALYCMESALSACQSYLTELNEDAIERRFETADDDAATAKATIIELLTSYARDLERLTGELGSLAGELGSLSGVDQLSIQKEIDRP